MNEFVTVLRAVLPVFAVAALGGWMRHRGWLGAEADRSLTRLTINLLLPALIFDSVVANPALRQAENLLLPPVLGFLLVAVGIGLAWLVAPLAGAHAAAARRTFSFLAGLQNYAYLTIPLCLALFDSRTTGVLFVHNVGAETALWTLGVAVLTGRGFAGGWRHLVNAPVIALVLGLVLNFLSQALPASPALETIGGILRTPFHWFGQSAIPISLLLVGCVVADHAGEARGGNAPRIVAAAALVRLVGMPLLFILLARFLPCSVELKRVLIIQGAMPSAMMPLVLTKHYGGDQRIALQIAFGTSFLGLVTIPLWIRLGVRLAGLPAG